MSHWEIKNKPLGCHPFEDRDPSDRYSLAINSRTNLAAPPPSVRLVAGTRGYHTCARSGLSLRGFPSTGRYVCSPTSRMPTRPDRGRRSSPDPHIRPSLCPLHTATATPHGYEHGRPVLVLRLSLRPASGNGRRTAPNGFGRRGRYTTGTIGSEAWPAG